MGIVRFEARRGSTTRDYHANTIGLSYSLPDSADAVVEKMTAATQPQVTRALNHLTGEYEESIGDITREMQPCDHCQDQEYETCVPLTVLRRAFMCAHRKL